MFDEPRPPIVDTPVALIPLAKQHLSNRYDLTLLAGEASVRGQLVRDLGGTHDALDQKNAELLLIALLAFDDVEDFGVM